jgi:serine/threonine-protein kinase
MNLISGARLKLGYVRQTESTKPADEVLEQSLKPDTRVPVGQTVNIVVARPEKAIVPNVPGPQSGKESGGNADTVKEPNPAGKSKETAPEPQTAVVARHENPQEQAATPAQAEVRPRTPASSAGMPQGVDSSASPSLRVPDVTGETRDEATTALRRAGFKLGAVSERLSLFRTAGRVYSQEPAAGVLVMAPKSVDLIISTGIPAWAVASLLVVAGTALGFLIRGRTQRWHKPPAEQAIHWSTRVHRDIGSQRIEQETILMGPDIRVRPIIDRGVQSIRETPSIRSDRAA